MSWPVLPSSASAAPNAEFAHPASEEELKQAAAALEAHGIHVVVAENGIEAKRLALEVVPAGSEVSMGASITLETIGVLAEIEQSGRYNAVRPACAPWIVPPSHVR